METLKGGRWFGKKANWKDALAEYQSEKENKKHNKTWKYYTTKQTIVTEIEKCSFFPCYAMELLEMSSCIFLF